MHLQLSALGFGVIAVQFLTFRRNHDNAVRTFGTVDSGSRSILQYVNRLDVTRGNVSNAVYRKSIHNVQRFAGLGERGASTHTDLDLGIG